MNNFNSKLISKEQLSPEVFLFRFETPEIFNFEAGQFVMIKVGENDKKPIFRAYSICSIPNQTNSFEIAVKLIPNGIGSEFLRVIEIGQNIETRGPMGIFTVNESETKHIFFATGIGITPFLPMIKKCLDENKKTELHYGGRTRNILCFDSFFSELENQNPKLFEYNLYTTREEKEGCKYGRITKFLPEYNLKPNDNYYICGGKEMIDEIRQILIEKEIPKENIHKEAFY